MKATRSTVAVLENTMTIGDRQTLGEYTFFCRPANQKWQVRHTSGQVAHSPGSLVQAFFKCREKVRFLASGKPTYRSNAPYIKAV